MNSTVQQNIYDVAIIGTGIAGSTLGAILARQGLNVILFEANSHPRFAIGESMILETSEVMRSLAELYDVPELAYFSSEHYFDRIGTSHGIKRHFSYLHHVEGQPLNQQHLLQAVIPQHPHGHELHLYRQDTDYYLMTLAIHYGAKVIQNTRIQSVNISSDCVLLTTKQERDYRTKYVVDAGGFRSVLAENFDLRHTNLKTHSRALFTHMVDVPCYHKTSASKQEIGLPFKLSEGTLHHVFHGGWLWIIPFDNHTRATNSLCSVGLMLDPRIHPHQTELSPEQEFFQFVERFPAIAVQFRYAKAVRSWIRTGRIQYGTKQVVGDRFCLLGQAAGFIDPLFSKGLYTALTCTSLVAERLLSATVTGDYTAANFRIVEETTQAFLHSNDRLVANTYASFSDYRLWSPISVVWLLGAYLELVKLVSSRALAHNRQDYYQRRRSLSLVGGGFSEFERVSRNIYACIEQLDLTNSDDIATAAKYLKQQLEQLTWMPHPFRAVLRGKNHLPNRKIHPRLFRSRKGFLGTGAYRSHFFDNQSLRSLVQFYAREQATYSQQALALKQAATTWKNKWLSLSKWGQTVAASALIASSCLGGVAITSGGQLPTLSDRASRGGESRVGLANFLESPTEFVFNCGNHAGQVVHANVDGDRLTIEIAYAAREHLSSTTIVGNLDSQGIFSGTYSTNIPSGRISGDVSLSFEQDGSAQGINEEWGNAIQIYKS